MKRYFHFIWIVSEVVNGECASDDDDRLQLELVTVKRWYKKMNANEEKNKIIEKLIEK